MNEWQILEGAVEAAHEETGLTIKILPRGHALGRQAEKADALVEVEKPRKRLLAEVKKWAPNTPFGALVNRMRRLGAAEEVILIADYVNGDMAERLRKAGIQFLDTAGNGFIKNEDLFVYVKGNKRKQLPVHDKEMKTGRAFQAAGLKVVYHFLRDQALLNAPYREIAKRAGVAVGNIGFVLDDLQQQGYIRQELKKKRREWADYEALLDAWVEEYPHKLRKKLHLGRYLGDPTQLMEFAPGEHEGLWGGEKAAEAYTGYLTPRDYIIYIHPEQLPQLLAHARLRKDRNGDTRGGARVDVYEIFWKDRHEWKVAGTTDPLITYADLVATGDPRNLDAGQRIREELLH